MKYFAILMAVFGVLIILMGLYIYTGHDDLIPRGYDPGKKDPEYLRYLGKVVMAVGLGPLYSAVAASISTKESLLPVGILIGVWFLMLWIAVREYKEH